MVGETDNVASVREEVDGLLSSLDILTSIEPSRIQAELARTEARAALLRSLLAARQPPALPPPASPPPASPPARKDGLEPRAPGKAGRPRRISPFAFKPGAALAPTGKAPPDLDSARRVALFIKTNGPKRIDGLRNGLAAMNVTQAQLDDALRSTWFERAGPCWSLSSDGQAQVQRDD